MKWTVRAITLVTVLTVGCAGTQTADKQKAPKATCETAVSRFLELCPKHPECKKDIHHLNKADIVATCKRENNDNHEFLACVTAVESIEDIDKCKTIKSTTKKTARQKTHEAIDRLDMIYRASAHYYTAPRVAAGTGLKIKCQFPANQPMTPDVRNKACCGGTMDIDNDNRCNVDTTQWTTPTWSALNFQMNDQHYFGYRYESSGVGAAARFTASAYADLDCDGVLSTFQRFGYGDTPDSDGYCSMKSSSAFYKDKELE